MIKKREGIRKMENADIVSLNDKLIDAARAEEILQELLDWYDIVDSDFQDGDTQEAAYTKTKRKLTRAIQEGLIEIKIETDPDGTETINVYQHLQREVKGIKADDQNDHGRTVKYKEVTGRAKTAVKDEKGSGNASKLYSYLGALSGYGPQPFINMRGRDNGIAECLGYIFLQV